MRRRIDRAHRVAVVNLALSGKCVSSITLDYAVTLRLDDVEIRIETEFSLRTPSGQVVRVDPERPGPGLEHLVCVLHGTVTAAVAEVNGTLALAFENGARVDVAPDQNYEAWNIAGSRGEKVVAMPGGELAIWDRNDGA